MDPFITLAELKLALDTNSTQNDDLYNQVIPFACDAVRAYCGRTFDTNLVSEARAYEYDPRNSMLMIEDATEISTVEIGGYTLPEDAWMAKPYGPQVYWIELPPFGGQSPAMGFTRNADTYYGSERWRAHLQKVVVTGTWGWAEIPTPVKQAAIWTAAAMSDNPSPYISQTIEGYSYTRANPLVDGIPARALDILSLYARPLL